MYTRSEIIPFNLEDLSTNRPIITHSLFNFPFNSSHLAHKADDDSKRTVVDHEGQEYAQDHGWGYIEVSSKDGLNVTTAMRTILQLMIQKTTYGGDAGKSDDQHVDVDHESKDGKKDCSIM